MSETEEKNANIERLQDLYRSAYTETPVREREYRGMPAIGRIDRGIWAQAEEIRHALGLDADVIPQPNGNVVSPGMLRTIGELSGQGTEIYTDFAQKCLEYAFDSALPHAISTEIIVQKLTEQPHPTGVYEQAYRVALSLSYAHVIQYAGDVWAAEWGRITAMQSEWLWSAFIARL